MVQMRLCFIFSMLHIRDTAISLIPTESGKPSQTYQRFAGSLPAGEAHYFLFSFSFSWLVPFALPVWGAREKLSLPRDQQSGSCPSVANFRVELIGYL
jgi:hypothetical protein